MSDSRLDDVRYISRQSILDKPIVTSTAAPGSHVLVLIQARDRLPGAVFAEVASVCDGLGLPRALPMEAEGDYHSSQSPFALAKFPSVSSARAVLTRCASVKMAVRVLAAAADASAMKAALAAPGSEVAETISGCLSAALDAKAAAGAGAAADGPTTAAGTPPAAVAGGPDEVGSSSADDKDAGAAGGVGWGSRADWASQRRSDSRAGALLVLVLAHGLKDKRAALPAIQAAVRDAALQCVDGAAVSAASDEELSTPPAWLTAVPVPEAPAAGSGAHAGGQGRDGSLMGAVSAVIGSAADVVGGGPPMLVLGERLCTGAAELLDRLQVRNRPFQGPTSLNHELSLLMANLGMAGPGEWLSSPRGLCPRTARPAS